MNRFIFPILTYHHISNHIDYYTAINEKAYRDQISSIQQTARIISLEEAFQLCVNGGDPTGLCSITFDDAYEDILLHLRYLAERGLCASVFIPTAYLGKTNNWNKKAPYLCNHLTKNQVKEVLSMGHHVYPHSHTHTNLAKATANKELEEMALCVAREECLASKSAVALLTGKNPLFFAYPFGCHNKTVRHIAASCYSAAFATEKTAFSRNWLDDLYQIHRLSVSKTTTINEIERYIHARPQ